MTLCGIVEQIKKLFNRPKSFRPDYQTRYTSAELEAILGRPAKGSIAQTPTLHFYTGDGLEYVFGLYPGGYRFMGSGYTKFKAGG